METNKNWVLGRPLVFGDKDQIAEIKRIKDKEEAKKLLLSTGMELGYADIDVKKTIVSDIKFKCFKCDTNVFAAIDDIDVNENDPCDEPCFGFCIECKSSYSLKGGLIFIKK